MNKIRESIPMAIHCRLSRRNEDEAKRLEFKYEKEKHSRDAYIKRGPRTIVHVQNFSHFLHS